jgi:hypothetical protein
MRTGSSSNPAMSDAIESSIVRLIARTTVSVNLDSLKPLTNFTIFRVVSSIGPLPARRLAAFL